MLTHFILKLSIIVGNSLLSQWVSELKMVLNLHIHIIWKVLPVNKNNFKHWKPLLLDQRHTKRNLQKRLKATLLKTGIFQRWTYWHQRIDRLTTNTETTCQKQNTMYGKQKNVCNMIRKRKQNVGEYKIFLGANGRTL